MNYKKLFAKSDMKKFITDPIKKRLRNDWQLIVAITGKTRVGKSSLALLLSRLIDDNFALKKNMLLIPEPQEVEKQFKELPAYSSYVVDEAIRAAYKGDWQTTVAKSLVKVYNTDAYKNVCTFMVLPNFSSLSKEFRTNLIDIHIHVLERGTAIVYYRDDDKDIDDPWYTDENSKLKARFLKRYPLMTRTTEHMLNAEKITKNYAFDFEFPNLKDIDPEFYKEYERAKIKSREDQVHREEAERFRLQDISKVCTFLSYQYLKNLKNSGIGSQREFTEMVCQGLIQQQNLSQWSWLTRNNLGILKNITKIRGLPEFQLGSKARKHNNAPEDQEENLAEITQDLVTERAK